MNKSFDPQKHKDVAARYVSLVHAVVAVLAVVIFIIAILLSLDDENTNTKFRKRYNSYNHGWTILVDGNRTMEDLPVKITSGKDRKILLKKALPDPIPKYSAIAVRNYHMKMEVRINGEVVYSYPNHSDTKIVDIISDEWSVINLKSDSSRGILEIEYTDDGIIIPFSGYIGDVYFGDDNSIIQNLKETNFWGFISGIILIIIGGMLLIVSWIYRKYTNQYPNAAMGFAFLCLGLWFSNRSKMPFLSTNNDRFFFLSLGAILLVAPFVILYTYVRIDEQKTLTKWGFRISLIIAAILLITCVFIHYNVQFIAMASYFAIIIACVLNGVLMYRASFGVESRGKPQLELLLNRSELVANFAMFPAAVIEMYLSRHELWTELSDFFRAVVVFYAITYMIFVLWRTYVMVQGGTAVSERLQESQLELMMGQIQPHFIFNTLSSIRTLVKVEPDVAYKMLYDFSNYLRANVDNVTNLDGIKFAAEVEHIKSYVNIEKVRFGERLNVEYDIGMTEFIVPPLSIQPLVENAIKHGVVKKIEGGTVWLRSFSTDQNEVVEVEDNGIGFSVESASRVFSIYNDNEMRVGMESNDVAIKALTEVLEASTLLDENGEPLKFNSPAIVDDLSGNGSESHKSKGLLNIILRLKEMVGAKIIIESQTGKGTKMTVLFPKAKIIQDDYEGIDE